MNKAQVVLYLFPNANPKIDFRVQQDSEDGEQFIAYWNVKDADDNDVPQPTETELQAAWDSMQPTTADLLATAQAKKKAEVSAAVSAKIVAGYAYPTAIASTGKTYVYGTTLEDQQNMTASRVKSDGSPTEIVKYRPSGGVGRIDHTRDEFVTISNTVFDRVNWYLDQVDVYAPQIYAVDATADSVNAIVVNIADPT